MSRREAELKMKILKTLKVRTKLQPLGPEEIRQSMLSPLWNDPHSGTLFDKVRPGESICLVVSDQTRKTAADRILPVLVSGFTEHGCSINDMFILVATGSHRHPTKEEILGIVGGEIAGLFEGRITPHDPDDAANLVYVGTTRRGNRILLNRRAVEADRLVTIGAATYHYHAGFGGGRKSIVPGLAARDTIAQNHSITLDPDADRILPTVEPGRLDGNPVPENMLEAAYMCRPDSIINTVLTPGGELAGVFCGEMDKAHRAACRLVEKIYGIDIEEPADMVIASTSAPNWIQSHKALFNASRAVKPGGRIVLVAPCPEGLGNERFRYWITRPDSATIFRELRHATEIYGQTALSTKERGSNTLLVTDLTDKDKCDLGIETAPDKNKAIEMSMELLAEQGIEEPTCYLMPEAHYTVPFCSKDGTNGIPFRQGSSAGQAHGTNATGFPSSDRPDRPEAGDIYPLDLPLPLPPDTLSGLQQKQEMTTQMLESLLAPRSIAVVGASRTPGKVGHEVVANLKNGGFKGAIVPINPKAKDILGIKCHPDIKDYGGEIDLSIIIVPVKYVITEVKESLQAGAKAICIITAGFKETGEDGAKLEQKIAALCRSKGARLLGPNCLGLINTEHKMNASFAQQMPERGGISVMSQSGAICTAVLDWAAGRHLGLAKLVSMGNKADISETDLLRALADDENTKVITAYLESITSGDDFIQAAELAATKKPVVMLKSGTTSSGAKAASSHTGSLAGADIAYGAAFKRSGIIRAETFESLFDFATAFAMQPLPAGKRVAIITNAGGPGIMTADAVEHSGLEVAALETNIASALKEKLPTAASVGNPIDVLGDATPERFVEALKAAQDDKTVDAIIVILTPQAMTEPAETARAIAASLDGSKPVLASFMGGENVMPGRDELVEAGLPDYPSPERAVASLRAMYEYAQWKQRPPRVVTRFPVNRRRAERVIARSLRMGKKQLGEAQAKDIMRAYGFTVPDGGLALNSQHAVEIAEKAGMPVAMKIASPDIIHKSDVGGVKLGLATPEAVRDAFDLMMMRIKEIQPDAKIEGVYVESMCLRGREIIMGMTRDRQFGPMLMFGLGGIFVEVMKDVAFHLAPITAREAIQMLKSTRSFALLEGARGQYKVDIEEVAQCLQRLSQLVTDLPQIAELDINPLIVGRIGTEPVLADARITLSEPDPTS